MEVDDVIGDTAYSEKENIKMAKKERFNLISKLNPMIMGGNRNPEEELEFNKDAGMFICKAGVITSYSIHYTKLDES